MRKFIKNIILFLVALVVMIEVYLRLTGLATDVPELQLYDNGYLIYTPLQEGRFVRGLRGEVSSAYQINTSGWNSIINYDSIETTTVALIGDSFIEGFYIDVNNSIGRKIEQLTKDSIKVHEYGFSGANIHDYRTLVKDLKEKGYQKIVINIGKKDVLAKSPSFSGKTTYNPQKILRKIYNNSATLRYFNVNMLIKEVLKKKPIPNGNIDENMLKNRFDSLAPISAMYIYEDSIFSRINTKFKMELIIHSRQPHNYGFNGHWNDNGAQNAAETIVNLLLKKK